MRLLLSVALSFVLALALSSSGARAAGNSTEIQRETNRTIEGAGGRVASFWWLPQEYWEATAKELGIPAEDQVKVRSVFRDYLLVGALETQLSIDKKQTFATIADIVGRAKFYRNGVEIKVLRQVNPDLERLAGKLVYLLRASLGGVREGFRLLPLPNVDENGQPILSGNAPGELRIEFSFDAAAPPQEIYWRAPFTAIAGAKKCPKGGEPLEASYSYCPWHGVKIDGTR